MQISKKKINNQLLKQIEQMWLQLVVDVKTVEEAEVIMKSLLSDTEHMAIVKRLAVAYWLSNKRSYGNIRDNLKVSSATIAAVGQTLENHGWKHALKKIKADEWATKWESKIKSAFKISDAKNI